MNRSVIRAIPVIVFFLLTFFFTPGHAGAQDGFQYRHTKGDQWHLTSTVDEEVLINGESLYKTEILNKISVKVLEGEGRDGLLWNNYRIAEKVVDSDVYAWNSEYKVEYRRDIRGRLSELDPDSPVPMVQNVPVYPEKALVPGDSWTEEGVEVFNLGPVFGINELVTIRFLASYVYEGTETLDGRILKKISVIYSYTLNQFSDLLQHQPTLDAYPVEISGDVRQEVLWDDKAGRNYAADGQFEYTYFMSSGEMITFRGQSQGKAYYATPMDKDALVKEITNLANDDVSASVTEFGVSVALENLHFIQDEPVLLPGEVEKLNDIENILRSYPERDILIIGHTAKVNSRGDGLLLSEQRAQTVARFLLKSGVRKKNQIVTRGMGHRSPVGDNMTEEGRRKNRRVEIIILEN